MRLLGVILAGGQSRRFGSDKALATYRGKPLIDHAVAAMERWCGRVVVAGRPDDPRGLADWPAQGMGPLAGLAAALRLATDEGFDAVLATGVDAPLLPADLPQMLAPGPAYIAEQPVIGLWPVATLDALTAILEGKGRHSLRALAELTGARAVATGGVIANINTPEDLAALEHADGL